MTSSDALLTIAEMAVGLAGFTAIVGTFARHGALSKLDRYRFIWLFISASVTALLAFVPIILSEGGLDGITLWRASSSIMIVIWLVQVGTWQTRFRRNRGDPEMGPSGLSQGPLLVIPSLVNLLIQIMNAGGVSWEPSAAVYIIGNLIWLYAAGLVFVSIVLERPEG